MEVNFFTKGSQNIQSVAREVLYAKLVEGTCGYVNFFISRKSNYTQFFHLQRCKQMFEFFHEKFAERVVNLVNCPKGRKVT